MTPVGIGFSVSGPMIHGDLRLPSPTVYEIPSGCSVRNLFSWRREEGRVGFFGKGKRRGYWSHAACGMVSRTNKPSTCLKLGWLMASWEKRYATMFIFTPPKFPFQSTLTGRELAAWIGGGAALEFTANPDGQPCSPSWPTVGTGLGTGKRPPDDCGLCAVQGSGTAEESFRLTFIHTAKRGASCRTQGPPASKTSIVPYQPSC